MMGDLFGEDYDDYYEADGEDDDYEAASQSRVLPTAPADPRNATALCGLQNQGNQMMKQHAFGFENSQLFTHTYAKSLKFWLSVAVAS